MKETSRIYMVIYLLAKELLVVFFLSLDRMNYDGNTFFPCGNSNNAK